MAAPAPEVLEKLDQLITAVTGFSKTQENFEPCRRYCLSHFVHHIYASVNKSTVRKTINDLENRFYTHGHFDLSSALRTQVGHFLSHQDTFKANPECQIEWSLLSLVTSLTKNLSSLHNVPPLLPLVDDTEDKDEFDWGSYLKEGLPVRSYNYDTDTDSFSSLSSDEDHSPVQFTEHSFSSVEPCPVVSVPAEDEKILDLKERKLFLCEVRKKCRDLLPSDLAKKGNFASKWQNLKSPTDPFILVSEKDAFEIILNCLMTGESLDGLRNATVCFLAKETFQGCLDSFAPCVQGIKSINDYVKFVERCEDAPVVVKVYASCLRRALLCYELKLLDVSEEHPSLIRLLEMMKPCFPYILGLCTVHNVCVASVSKNEPSWQTSLRILAGLYNSLITNHSPELRSLLVGIFLQCHAVYGRIIDALLTSASATDPHQEFYISSMKYLNRKQKWLISQFCIFNPFNPCMKKQVDLVMRIFRSLEASGESMYVMQPHESPLPFVEIVSKQVKESRDSLSVLYKMNRFLHLNNEVFISINKSVFETLKRHFLVEINHPEETDLYKVMSQLEQNDCGEDFDFGEVPRWIDSSECVIPINKIFETALNDAVLHHLDVARNTAIAILVQEMNLPRHLRLLRDVYLCHDASLLLPFLQVLFKEENSWANADYLTTLLRECIGTDFPDLAGNVSVVICIAEGQVPQTVVQAIDCMEISYQVPYPISLVITPTVLSKYNAIHRTLLKLKWAHTLSYLRFPDKKLTLQPAVRCVMHRLQILRFSCLADLQVISNYFMAQATTTMPKNCEDYSDIQSLIQDHEHLMERIHSRCMLSEGDHNYTLIFGAIIPLVVDLRRCWLLEQSNIISKLKLMESIYRGTHTKLRRLMGYLEKETYVPLVAKMKEESLSATQQTNFSKYASFG